MSIANRTAYSSAINYAFRSAIMLFVEQVSTVALSYTRWHHENETNTYRGTQY